MALIFAVLQLDNAITGIENRFAMIEQQLAQLGRVDFVMLPELSTPGYLPTYELWQYKEPGGMRTKTWAAEMAKKYNIHLACGYLDFSDGDYYNAYLIAGPEGVCGSVYKEEAESNIFCRGKFSHVISTPLGNIGVGICFDSHRACFYEGIKKEELVLILMPHAWAMPVGRHGKVDPPTLAKIDFLCRSYADAFGVPVLFCNATGPVDRMAGVTGTLMSNYRLMGQSGVYLPSKAPLHFKEARIGLAVAELAPRRLQKQIQFYDDYIDKGSFLFRHLVLPSDIRKGVQEYQKHKQISTKD